MRRRGRIHGEEAQGLIEFALFAMIAMFIFLGTVDLSRFMYFDVAIHSAARVGAEVAGNHCTPSCGALPITTDDWVVQTVVCEGNIALRPQPAQGCGYVPLSGAPGNFDDPYNPSATAYAPTEPSLTQDVYVSPSYAPNGGTQLPSSPTQVTVDVGYRFIPITPLMQQFLPAISCFPGDDTAINHHTICATASGKIST